MIELRKTYRLQDEEDRPKKKFRSQDEKKDSPKKKYMSQNEEDRPKKEVQALG